MYLLEHLCRTCAAVPHLCEFMWLHGASNSGKDVVMCLITAFLGLVPKGGFTASLPPDYFQKLDGRADPNAHTAFLSQAMRARAVLVPEVPQRALVKMDLLKSLCEQQGVPVANRDCGGRADCAKPQFETWFTSNRNIDLPADLDSGTARRVNVMSLRERFVEANPKDGERLADSSLKQRIERGDFNYDLFYVLKEFYDYLFDYSMNIERPPRVDEETKEALAPDEPFLSGAAAPQSAHAWVVETFEPCTVEEAAPESVVKDRVCRQFRVGKKDAGTKLIELGFLRDRTSNKRYQRYAFDQAGTAKVPVRVRPYSALPGPAPPLPLH